MKLESLTKYYTPELVNRFFDVLTIQKGLSKILMDLTASGLSIVFGLILLQKKTYSCVIRVFRPARRAKNLKCRCQMQ